MHKNALLHHHFYLHKCICIMASLAEHFLQGRFNKWLFYFRNMPEEKKILMKLHPPWHLHPCLRITEVVEAEGAEAGTLRPHPPRPQWPQRPQMTIGDGMHPHPHLPKKTMHPGTPTPPPTILGATMTIITIRQVQAMIPSILSIILLLNSNLRCSNILPQPQTLTR